MSLCTSSGYFCVCTFAILFPQLILSLCFVGWIWLLVVWGLGQGRISSSYIDRVGDFVKSVLTTCTVNEFALALSLKFRIT